MDDGEARGSGKRDRVARLTRVVRVLRANPEGLRIEDLAARLGMSKRTVYRDLTALQDELQIATWSDGGVWGVLDEAFMPTLQLTRQEAMAIVLAARLMVRYADKYDPALASTFEKLEGVLPPALAGHVEQTLAILAKAPRDERFSQHVETLTRAWAERRVVTIDYEPARYGPHSAPRTATVRPYLIEPSLQTHALYLIGFDEEKQGLRTFKIERIRSIAMTPRTFDAARSGGDPGRPARGVGHHRGPATHRGRAALRARGRRPGARDDLALQPGDLDRARRLADLARDRRRPRRDPTLDHVVGRRGRGPRAARPARRRSRSTGPRARALRIRGRVVSGHPFDAVNLISDPIHGYVELTKRLTRAESGALGLPDEDAAEDDLIDTAWVQRLRRISQLQSARWVFPTAEHSRFTHGLGVMHEAGLWARSLYPTLRTALRAVDGAEAAIPSEGLVVETLRIAGLLHDVGHGPFAHYFDDHVLAAFAAPADPRRPAGKRLSHEDLSQLIIEHELGDLIREPATRPGRGRAARRPRRRRAHRPAGDRLPRLEAGPRRSGDAALGPLAAAAPVGRLHGRQPRLRPARRLHDGRVRWRRSTWNGCGATRSCPNEA